MGAGMAKHVFNTVYTIDDIKEYITKTYTRAGLVIHGSGDEFISIDVPPRFDQMSALTFDMYFRYQGTVSIERSGAGSLLYIRLPGYYTRQGLDQPADPPAAHLKVVQDELYNGEPSKAAPSSTTSYTITPYHIYMVLLVALVAMFFSVVRPVLVNYYADTATPDITIHS